MPRGLFSVLTGLGIQTRRRGDGVVGITSDLSKASLCSGRKLFTLSIPAVFFPVLSWVTLRGRQLRALHPTTQLSCVDIFGLLSCHPALKQSIYPVAIGRFLFGLPSILRLSMLYVA